MMDAAGDNHKVEFDYSEEFESAMNNGKGASKWQKTKYAALRERGCQKVTVHIYNIKDGAPGDKPGFIALKEYLETDR